MADPRFSILLPTHNRAEVLKFAVDSVLAQTFPSWELLVVGDGCTDGTADLMAGYTDPRIRWFDLPKGLGFGYGNRNIALRQAKGDLIAFLGHDNVYFRDHLERMAPCFDDPAAQFAYSRPLFIGNDGVIVPFFVNLHLYRARLDFMQIHNVLPATTIVHRRSCLDQVGYWNDTLHEHGDWEMWKRIFVEYPQGIRVQRVPSSLHFRANWREGTNWAPPPFPYLRALKEFGAWYPYALDMKFSAEGPLPQERVWTIMQADPTKFLGELRYCVDLLQDHLAWSGSMDQNFN